MYKKIVFVHILQNLIEHNKFKKKAEAEEKINI